jgi:DNA-binding NarL/FixJ family response regulator
MGRLAGPAFPGRPGHITPMMRSQITQPHRMLLAPHNDFRRPHVSPSWLCGAATWTPVISDEGEAPVNLSPQRQNPSRLRDGAARPRSVGSGSADSRLVDVLLVDDDPSASYSLRTLLGAHAGIRVRATAETSAQAFHLAQLLKPDVCLVSARLGSGEWMRFAYRLKGQLEPRRVLICTDERVDPVLEGLAVIARADGIVWRYDDPGKIAARIRRRSDRGPRPSSPLSREVIHAVIDRVEDRDRPIAAMLLLHTPPDEIARTVGIGGSALRLRRTQLIDYLDRDRISRGLRTSSSSPQQDSRDGQAHGYL